MTTEPEVHQAVASSTGDGAHVPDADKLPTNKGIKVTSFMSSFLEDLAALDQNAETSSTKKVKPPASMQHAILNCQLKLNAVAEKDTLANFSIKHVIKGKEIYMCHHGGIVDGKKMPQFDMLLHGPLSLQPSPVGYKLCDIGNWSVYVDGSRCMSADASELVNPCIGWYLPKSGDTEEQTLFMHDEEFNVDATRGPIKVTHACTAKILKLKDDYDGVSPLVRPLLPGEEMKHQKKRKAETVLDMVNKCVSITAPATEGSNGASAAAETPSTNTMQKANWQDAQHRP